MLTDQELSEVVEDLTSSDASFRCVMLRVLWERPAADERLLPYLEYLLHDESPCLLAIPYRFGVITRSG